MPNPQPTGLLAQVPDQPNDLPTPDPGERTPDTDEVPATPPTEPEPVPIEDPRPDTQPPGPYVV
ncbi:MAG: hypothetical protein Q8T13_20680 [Acidobacteriota bacterium]|nr:hypothetical protein [Acidobacteriota bacterium]